MFKQLIILCWCSLGLFGVVEAEDLPDPTRPLEYSGPSQPQQQQLQLNSVLISGDRKIAVINGIQLLENEWFGDNRIVSIHANSVTLERRGRTIVLSLYDKVVRQ